MTCAQMKELLKDAPRPCTVLWHPDDVQDIVAEICRGVSFSEVTGNLLVPPEQQLAFRRDRTVPRGTIRFVRE